METKINVGNLSPEELNALKQSVLAEEKKKLDETRQMRENYKLMRDDQVRYAIGELEALSALITEKKRDIFARFEHVRLLKKRIFTNKEGIKSDTYTTADGKMSITIGEREVKRFDDTATEGVIKVKAYLKSLARDENSGNLVEIVMNLLKKDHKGNLKAENIPALRKYAEKSNDAEFLDGVEIIERALVMEKSCLFVAATVTDEHGKKKSLPLSMSAAD